jgi:hypothetical protein
MQAIAQFTEGIPRNINNFCFNALSLGCALRQREISVSIVEEVISDLDITRHITEVSPFQPLDPESPGAAGRRNSPVSRDTPHATENQSSDTLTPAEAKAYMQQLTRKLRVLKRKRCQAPATAFSSQDHEETVRLVGFDSGDRQ